MNIKHLALFLLFSLGTGIAQASTEAEIRSLVEANIAYTNEQLSQDPAPVRKLSQKLSHLHYYGNM